MHRLRALAEPLGMQATDEPPREPFAVHQVAGAWRDRPARISMTDDDARNPVLRIELAVPLAVTLAVAPPNVMASLFEEAMGLEPFEGEHDGYGDRRVYGDDAEWTTAVLADPIARPLLLRHSEETEGGIHVEPGWLVLRRLRASLDVQTEQLSTWLDELSQLADRLEHHWTAGGRDLPPPMVIQVAADALKAKQQRAAGRAIAKVFLGPRAMLATAPLPAMFVGMVAGVVGYERYIPLETGPFTAWCVGLAGLAMGVVVALGRRYLKGVPFFWTGPYYAIGLMMAAAFGFAGTAWINGALDGGPPVDRHVEVVRTWSTSTEGGGRMHLVELTAWREGVAPTSLELSEAFVSGLEPGDPLVLVTRPGRLGVEWVDEVRTP